MFLCSNLTHKISSMELSSIEMYMTKTYAPGQHPKSVIRKAHELYPEYKHPQALPPAVVKELQPIYKRLSQPELLQKCMHGQTQNPCESFNKNDTQKLFFRS